MSTKLTDTGDADAIERDDDGGLSDSESDGALEHMRKAGDDQFGFRVTEYSCPFGDNFLVIFVKLPAQWVNALISFLSMSI